MRYGVSDLRYGAYFYKVHDLRSIGLTVFILDHKPYTLNLVPFLYTGKSQCLNRSSRPPTISLKKPAIF